MSYLVCLCCQAASRNWTRQASPDTDVTPVSRTVDFQQLKAFGRALNGFHAVCSTCLETFGKCVERPQFFGRNWNVAMASVKARLECFNKRDEERSHEVVRKLSTEAINLNCFERMPTAIGVIQHGANQAAIWWKTSQCDTWCVVPKSSSMIALSCFIYKDTYAHIILYHVNS